MAARAPTAAGLPAVCIETRHAKAVLKAQVNKSDRNDARGIAQMMRVNLFKPVHVKSLESQKRRALLSARRLVLEKAIAVENDMRGLLRNFGLKVGAIGKAGFEARILELIEDAPDMAVFIDSLLTVRRTLREEFARLHKRFWRSRAVTPSPPPDDDSGHRRGERARLCLNH